MLTFMLRQDRLLPPRCSRRLALAVALCLLAPVMTAGADELPDDAVGLAEQLWNNWSGAIKSLESDQTDEAAKKFEALAGANIPPLRLALLADRTGTLRLEQTVKNGGLGEGGKKLIEQIEAGRKQKMLAEDGWHFAAIGRFSYADANFKALLDSAPDPVALLELTRANDNRHTILIKLMANTEVGPSAKAFLDLLNEGEELLRKDSLEISADIARLGGTPRQVFNATRDLKAAGEYAVPQLLRYLQDPAHAALHPMIIRVLPELGRPALNPLVVALQLPDAGIRRTVIETLARVGYRQALPYLARVAQGADKAASGDLREAAKAAMRDIEPKADLTAAELFVDLAEAYHADMDSVRADDRSPMANVWYSREGGLTYIPVPREIFRDVMAMRCCEAVLELQPNNTTAASLWLASNFRREARLGMNVESEADDAAAKNDATRPEKYPRSIYFARAAGPLHNHMVVSRAVKDRDPAEALGGLSALMTTAGSGGLLSSGDAQQGVVECLTFPHRLVRIKAALAIARSLPNSQFNNSHQVAPVLAEAITLSARKTALVIDPDDQNRNKTQAVLRAAGLDAIADRSMYNGLNVARGQNATHFDLIVVSSDVQNPGIADAVKELRGDFLTSAAPIVIIAKAGDTSAAQTASASYGGVSVLLAEAVAGGTAEAATEALLERYRRANSTLGVIEIGEEEALSLAMQAVESLRMVAISGSKIIDYARSEPALIRAMESDRATGLRIAAASTLATIATPTAQEALATQALNDKNAMEMRLAAFSSLAESARRNGNRLGETTVGALTSLAVDGADLTIRTSCSQVVGALDLPSNRITQIIQAQSKG